VSKDIVLKFVDAVNKQNLHLIIEMMSDDFCFIDTYGNKEKYWKIPACWKVAVKDNRIQVWQVFCDSKKQLDSMK
jgi:hypothetical protein